MLLYYKHPFLLAKAFNDIIRVLFDYFERIKLSTWGNFMKGCDQVQEIGLAYLKSLKKTYNFRNECSFIDFDDDLFAEASCIYDLLLQKQAVFVDI